MVYRCSIDHEQAHWRNDLYRTARALAVRSADKH